MWTKKLELVKMTFQVHSFKLACTGLKIIFTVLLNLKTTYIAIVAILESWLLVWIPLCQHN